ncbi:MAG: aminoacyl-tRNA hydrolase [Lachnospiraceae bacterium]|nr:aminoacyl-tRNA hydrolase [Lachnospiraceae bacterium]
MFIIIGLGNPGMKYAGTRHNIGFDIVDALAKKHNIKVKSLKHKTIMGKGSIYGHKVFLAKPFTYMNLSGEPVRRIIEYYHLDEKNELIVIADDISLPTGQIRMRKKGSDGGHNGLKSIINNFGHNEFIRMKIGVGDKKDGDLIGHVLGHFSGSDKKIMRECTKNAVAAIEAIIEDGLDKAMNVYNRKIDEIKDSQ